ncbi:MAG: hypothetical protein ACREMV_09235 [Gemmatimonadales bacterium]
MLVSLALGSGAVMIVALATARLLTSSTAALRHGVWTAAIVSVLALPAASVALPPLGAPILGRGVACG